MKYDDNFKDGIGVSLEIFKATIAGVFLKPEATWKTSHKTRPDRSDIDLYISLPSGKICHESETLQNSMKIGGHFIGDFPGIMVG